MALKITLKPNERMIIGGAVMANGNRKECNLLIENNVPILREKDILSEKDAGTLCGQIYFTIQLMYIDEKNLVKHYNAYWKLIHHLMEAAPNLLGLIDQISELIVGNKYYQALKLAKQLTHYEQEVIEGV
jgi:flagellar protein FlbT